jgi:hypothetical protein
MEVQSTKFYLYQFIHLYGSMEETCGNFYLSRGHEILMRGHDILLRRHDIRVAMI